MSVHLADWFVGTTSQKDCKERTDGRGGQEQGQGARPRRGGDGFDIEVITTDTGACFVALHISKLTLLTVCRTTRPRQVPGHAALVFALIQPHRRYFGCLAAWSKRCVSLHLTFLSLLKSLPDLVATIRSQRFRGSARAPPSTLSRSDGEWGIFTPAYAPALARSRLLPRLRGFVEGREQNHDPYWCVPSPPSFSSPPLTSFPALPADAPPAIALGLLAAALFIEPDVGDAKTRGTRITAARLVPEAVGEGRVHGGQGRAKTATTAFVRGGGGQ